MKLESLKSSKFKVLKNESLAKITGGYTVEDSPNKSITRDNGKTWESCAERVTMDKGFIICRELFYDGAWH